MPKVTVLTAVRNGEIYLPATIASIQAQTFADWEYLIVDDASTDATCAIVQAAAAADSRIRLIRRARCGGPFIAANDGLRQARGRYIVRTDGDDISLPQRIAQQLAWLAAHPWARASATFCQSLDATGPIANNFHIAPLSPRALAWYLCLRCPLVHSSACIEREALCAIGGYRPLPLAQDYAMWCDLAQRGWIGTFPEVLVYFRRHQGRVSVRSPVPQRALAINAIRNHLSSMWGKDISEATATIAYAVGHSEIASLPESLDFLNAWDRAWMQDSTLDSEGRQELTHLSAFRRRKMLRSNLRRQPVAFLRHLRSWAFPQPVYS